MIKKLLLVIAVGLLAGCSTVADSYLMTKFDGNEYQLVAEVRVDAHNAATKCDDAVVSKANAITIARKTQLFETYSQYLPHNGDSYKASQSLNEIAQGLADHYNKGTPVSSLFCKLKFEGMEHSADVIQHVLGNRPR